MTAFDRAAALMYQDRNMVKPAIYKVAGTGAGVTVSVYLSQPDVMLESASVRAVVKTTMIEVQVSQVASPKAGDTFTIGTEVYTVFGRPARDTSRLFWSCEANGG